MFKIKNSKALLIAFAGLLYASALPASAQTSAPLNNDEWVSLEDIMRRDGIDPPSPAQTWQSQSNSAYQPLIKGDTLSPGDKFRVTIKGHEKLSQIYTVNAAGETDFDLIGPLVIRGLSMADLAVNIQRLYNQHYLRNSVVKIERFIAPIAVSLVRKNRATVSISVDPQSSVLDVLTKTGALPSITPSSIIIIKDQYGQSDRILTVDSVYKEGPFSPRLTAGQKIVIQQWAETITQNNALQSTPYLRALIEQSRQSNY